MSAQRPANSEACTDDRPWVQIAFLDEVTDTLQRWRDAALTRRRGQRGRWLKHD